MAYRCEIGSGHTLYLENQGTQTIVTLSSHSPGQQQQSGTSFSTGSWTAPPQVLSGVAGVIVRLTTATGKLAIQIQGTSLRLVEESASIDDAQSLPLQTVADGSMLPIQPLEPLAPMKPMQMGNMQMTLNPMQMRMGNLSMRTGGETSTSTESQTPRFCSQCGASLKVDDRFCSQCGYQVG